MSSHASPLRDRAARDSHATERPLPLLGRPLFNYPAVVRPAILGRPLFVSPANVCPATSSWQLIERLAICREPSTARRRSRGQETHGISSAHPDETIASTHPPWRSRRRRVRGDSLRAASLGPSFAALLAQRGKADAARGSSGCRGEPRRSLTGGSREKVRRQANPALDLVRRREASLRRSCEREQDARRQPQCGGSTVRQRDVGGLY